MKNKFHLIAIILFFIFCILIKNQLNRMIYFDSEKNCEYPIVSEFPDSLPFKISDINAYKQPKKIPPWWKKDNRFRIPKGNYGNDIKKIVTQEESIWLAYYHLIQQYNPVTKKSLIYKYTNEGYPIDRVKDIFVSENEVVWAIIEGNRTHKLIYYDPDNHGFLVIPKFENLFPEWNDDQDFNPIVKFHETFDNGLIISYDDRLVMYSPQENVVNQLLDQNFNFTINSLVKSEIYLWFTVFETSDLWQLNMTTKELIKIESNLKNFKEPIIIDDLGRIWLGYQARYEPNEKGNYHWWYPDSLPIEFIHPMLWNEDTLSEPDWRLELAPVNNLFVDSTGSLWFSSRAGLIKYDVSKDQWCISMSKSIKSIVAEDKNGYLWMVPTKTSYWGLYKYQFSSE